MSEKADRPPTIRRYVLMAYWIAMFAITHWPELDRYWSRGGGPIAAVVFPSWHPAVRPQHDIAAAVNSIARLIFHLPGCQPRVEGFLGFRTIT